MHNTCVHPKSEQFAPSNNHANKTHMQVDIDRLVEHDLTVIHPIIFDCGSAIIALDCEDREVAAWPDDTITLTPIVSAPVGAHCYLEVRVHWDIS